MQAGMDHCHRCIRTDFVQLHGQGHPVLRHTLIAEPVSQHPFPFPHGFPLYPDIVKHIGKIRAPGQVRTAKYLPGPFKVLVGINKPGQNRFSAQIHDPYQPFRVNSRKFIFAAHSLNGVFVHHHGAETRPLFIQADTRYVCKKCFHIIY